MSQWTHIAGTIRLDGLGPVIGLDKEGEIENIQYLLSMSPLPFGSEGPINYHFEHHGDDGPGHSSMYRGSLVFWGDLRDFGEERVEDIIKWLNWIVGKIAPQSYNREYPWTIRDLVASIDVESTKQKILVYSDWKKGILTKKVRVSG